MNVSKVGLIFNIFFSSSFILATVGVLDPLLDDGPELNSALDKDDTDYAPDQSDAGMLYIFTMH